MELSTLIAELKVTIAEYEEVESTCEDATAVACEKAETEVATRLEKLEADFKAKTAELYAKYDSIREAYLAAMEENETNPSFGLTVRLDRIRLDMIRERDNADDAYELLEKQYERDKSDAHSHVEVFANAATQELRHKMSEISQKIYEIQGKIRKMREAEEEAARKVLENIRTKYMEAYPVMIYTPGMPGGDPWCKW